MLVLLLVGCEMLLTLLLFCLFFKLSELERQQGIARVTLQCNGSTIPMEVMSSKEKKNKKQ